MGVKVPVRYEVQWHAADGAGIRRLIVTWQGARRLMLALGMVGLVVVVGWSLAGLDGLVTHFPVAAAERQNRALRAQQEMLREQVIELAGRLFQGVERGRRLARLTDTRGRAWESLFPLPPARDAGDAAILAWLSEQGTRLEVIGNELTTISVEMSVKRASTPAPPDTGTGPVRNAAVQVADLGSVGRQAAAPAKR